MTCMHLPSVTCDSCRQQRQPYGLTGNGLFAPPRKGWVCPLCGTVWSPIIFKCVCQPEYPARGEDEE